MEANQEVIINYIMYYFINKDNQVDWWWATPGYEQFGGCGISDHYKSYLKKDIENGS